MSSRLSALRTGTKGGERGLTILEIFIMLVLVLLSTVSVVAVHGRHAKVQAVRNCEDRRWSRVSTAQEIEWNARKWEWTAGACIRAGIVPIEAGPAPSSIRLWSPDASIPLSESASSPAELRIPAAGEFVMGQKILICGENEIFRATIRSVEYGKRQNALLQAEVEDGSSPQGSLPQGTLVSAVASVTYTTEPGGKPPEQILYEERNKQGRGPVLTGFERFKLEGRADREHSAVVVALELASEGCSLTREFPVFGGPIDESPGRWRLRGENLVFEPWVAPVARAGP